MILMVIVSIMEIIYGYLVDMELIIQWHIQQMELNGLD